MMMRRVRKKANPVRRERPTNWDWAQIPDESLPELKRQAELQMDAILTTSIAADQKAMTLAGIFGAISAALVVVATTFAGAQKVDLAAALSTGLLSAGLLCGSLTCAFSGRPRMFYPSGYQPKLLSRFASNTQSVSREIIQDLQLRITENRDATRRIAQLTFVGYGIAVATIVLSGALYIAIRAFGH